MFLFCLKKKKKVLHESSFPALQGEWERNQLSTPNVISDLRVLIQYLFAISFTNHIEKGNNDVTGQFLFFFYSFT